MSRPSTTGSGSSGDSVDGAASAHRRRRRSRMEVASDGVEEDVRVNRLGNVIVHPGGDAGGTLLERGMRGHGDDRQRRETAVGTDVRRRLIAIHLGHLQIHEDHVVGGRVRPPQQRLDGFAAVVRDVHRGAGAFEQFDGDLLVDVVVLGQKDARAEEHPSARRRRPASEPFPSRPRWRRRRPALSTSIDLVTGLTRKPSRWSASASSRTSSRPKAVTMMIAGWLLDGRVVLDEPRRLAGRPCRACASP